MGLTVARPARLRPVALARVDGWEAAFAAFVEERRHRPFAWGSNDCGLFAADNILALCGVDVAASLRGYDGAVGAARSLARHGLRQVDDVPSALCLPERLPIDGRRGDLVSFRSHLGVTLGVVMGERFAAPGERGLLFFGLRHALRAWRVG